MWAQYIFYPFNQKSMHRYNNPIHKHHHNVKINIMYIGFAFVYILFLSLFVHKQGKSKKNKYHIYNQASHSKVIVTAKKKQNILNISLNNIHVGGCLQNVR